MLRVPLIYAKPEMTLALPVADPSMDDRYLLHAGFKLDGRAISRLGDFNVHEIWVRYPPLQKITKRIDQELIEKRANITKQIGQAFETVQPNTASRLDYDDYCRAIASLMESVIGNPSAAILLDELGDEDQTLLKHCSTVSYLSLLIGLKLDSYLVRQRKKLAPNYARQVGPLGVGAMLHDLGMLRLDSTVRDRYEQTLDQSDPEWQKHVTLGYELVRGNVDPSAAVVVLHHHQHFDGSGFPMRGLDEGQGYTPTGEQIHVFARIAAVADTFDTLQHPHPEVTVPTVRVIGMMLQPPIASWFDPDVLRAFLSVVPVYSPGTLLQLNDSRWAVAIDHSAGDPCRPVVQIVKSLEDLTEDKAKWKQSAEFANDETEDEEAEDESRNVEILDLRQHPDLHVTMVGTDRVGDYNFPPPTLVTDRNAVAPQT